jgi:hypothetical protein
LPQHALEHPLDIVMASGVFWPAFAPTAESVMRNTVTCVCDSFFTSPCASLSAL